MADPAKLRVFVDADADVLIAGAASPNAHSASLVVLQMAEITLIEALTSEQVIEECERNLREKLRVRWRRFACWWSAVCAWFLRLTGPHSNPIKGWPIPKTCPFWSQRCWPNVRG